MVDAVKNLTINDAKYYGSNTATASDSQGDLTLNPETVTHNINRNETVTHARKGNFEQNLFSNRTIPLAVLLINPKIDQNISPATKEVVADTASGSACDNRNPRQVSPTGVDRITPGNIFHAVSVYNASSPVLIVIVATSPPCGIIRKMYVAKKWQSTSPGLGGNTQKLDAVVDGKLPD